MKNSQLVQMRLRQGTINKAARLQSLLNASNRADVVRTSLDLTEMVAEALSNGSSLIIEDPSGKREKIMIPGITTKGRDLS